MKHLLLRTALILFTTTTVSLAAVDDILANVGTFKPKITVSDSYSEKVLTEVDDGSVFRSVVPNDQRIAVTVIANLDGADVGVIDATTQVGVTAGYFDHMATLGDAEDYKPTSKRAVFPLTKEVYNDNGDSRTVRVGAVTYAWTAKALTITVTCTDIEEAGVSDIAASDYIGLATPGTPEAIVDEPIDVSVIFGDATGARRAFLRGITKTVTRGFGSIAADTYEELDLNDVTLQGSADVSGPAVKASFPAKPTPLNTIDVAGTATDTTEATLDTVTINGVPAAGAVITFADADGNGVWEWSVTGLTLNKGANAVTINFSDEDGNVTKVSKSYRIK